MTLIIANVFGILGMLSTFVIYQQRENRKLLIWKLITDSLWIVYYALCHATSVVAITVVAILRTLLLLNQQHEWAQKRAWLWIFLVVSLISSAIGWENWTSSLTALSSIVCIVAYWSGKPRINRLLSIPGAGLFLAKVAIDGSWWGIACSIFHLVSAILGFIRLDLPEIRKEKKN